MSTNSNLKQTRQQREWEQMADDREIAATLFQNQELNCHEARQLLVALAEVLTLAELRAIAARYVLK